MKTKYELMYEIAEAEIYLEKILEMEYHDEIPEGLQEYYYCIMLEHEKVIEHNRGILFKILRLEELIK